MYDLLEWDKFSQNVCIEFLVHPRIDGPRADHIVLHSLKYRLLRFQFSNPHNGAI